MMTPPVGVHGVVRREEVACRGGGEGRRAVLGIGATFPSE